MAERCLWKQNIIAEEVAEYIDGKIKEVRGDKERFPLHKDVHHGLSSQAMTFSLIGPMMVKNDLTPLKKAVEGLDVPWSGSNVRAVFEYDSLAVFGEESLPQPTSINLAILSNNKGNNGLFIKAQLTQVGFDGCSAVPKNCDGDNPYCANTLEDGCHLQRTGRKYWQRLEEFGFTELPSFKEKTCPLAKHYQFFRNVLFAFANGGTFILLHDERNPAFLNTAEDGTQVGFWPVLRNSVPEDKHQHVLNLLIQKVVAAIEESGQHTSWIQDFKDKYGLSLA